jgi:filamentous hemagglutinin family protein
MAAWLCHGALSTAHAQIHPNGATATTVTAGAGGRPIITPALPKNDVSYNAFSRFDVHAGGATFANAQIRARTIVGEVFSPLPSRIEGPINVDGPRTNLILANQNGIRVNGGSFVNFGSLALTTGAVSLRDVPLSPDTTQRYVDLRTRQGEIQIEAGGLDANVIRLELNAKKIGIAGPLTNAFTSATALTRLVAGDSDASFDTLASPTDNLTPWLTYQTRTADSPVVDGVALDITAGSTVRSGRVEIIVTDQGAGVRNAGTLGSTAGDFRLTATGRVEQIGGRIEAAGDIRLKAGHLHQSRDGARPSAVVSGGSLRIDTQQGTEWIVVDGASCQSYPVVYLLLPTSSTGYAEMFHALRDPANPTNFLPGTTLGISGSTQFSTGQKIAIGTSTKLSDFFVEELYVITAR